MVTTYLKIVGKIKGQRNTYTKPIQTGAEGAACQNETVQFGIALNIATHNILKENYGI